MFSLSLSADGAVPVHHKVYAGNRTDDTTHIETWNWIRKITPGPDFLYVADSNSVATSSYPISLDKADVRSR